MPLPAALKNRLKRRGLLTPTKINEKDEQKVPATARGVTEEVFAEDYDEPIVALQSEQIIRKTANCPNKINEFHECTDYCKNRYGLKSFIPISERMEEKKEKLIAKYPLPEHWKEVADPDTGRYYYWNIEDDMVSWLPPGCPKTKIGPSAEKLSKHSSVKKVSNVLIGKIPGSRNVKPNEVNGVVDKEKEKPLKLSSYHGKEPPSKRRKDLKNDDPLDPMDPASYSDVGRGTWTTGLPTGADAKTGVDHTVTGPLFQQRPYPSPGDVLRQNRKLREDNKVSSAEQIGVAMPLPLETQSPLIGGAENHPQSVIIPTPGPSPLPPTHMPPPSFTPRMPLPPSIKTPGGGPPPPLISLLASHPPPHRFTTPPPPQAQSPAPSLPHGAVSPIMGANVTSANNDMPSLIPGNVGTIGNIPESVVSMPSVPLTRGMSVIAAPNVSMPIPPPQFNEPSPNMNKNHQDSLAPLSSLTSQPPTSTPTLQSLMSITSQPPSFPPTAAKSQIATPPLPPLGTLHAQGSTQLLPTSIPTTERSSTPQQEEIKDTL